MKLQFLNLKQRYNLKDYKFTLILLVLAVSVIGVFMVGSANAEYQPRQIMGVGKRNNSHRGEFLTGFHLNCSNKRNKMQIWKL